MLISLAAFLLLAAHSPLEVTLPPEQRIAVLEIQRQQYRALAAREENWGKMLASPAGQAYLAAQRELDEANAAMTRKQAELQKLLNCPGCVLQGDDLRLVKPLPATIAVTPNQ